MTKTHSDKIAFRIHELQVLLYKLATAKGLMQSLAIQKGNLKLKNIYTMLTSLVLDTQYLCLVFKHTKVQSERGKTNKPKRNSTRPHSNSHARVKASQLVHLLEQKVIILSQKSSHRKILESKKGTWYGKIFSASLSKARNTLNVRKWHGAILARNLAFLF